MIRRTSIPFVLIVAMLVAVVGGALLLRQSSPLGADEQARSGRGESRETKVRRTSVGGVERGGSGRAVTAHRASDANASNVPTPAAGVQESANAEGNCVVSGTVVDLAGEPVAGAQVLIASKRDEPTSGAVSDASGNFQLAIPSPGDVTLSARSAGYVDSRAKRVDVIEAGQRVTGIVLALRPPHFLAGTITDAAGNPLEAVIVRAQAWEAGDSGIGEAVSAADGSYRIEGLSDGMHYVGLEHPRFGKQAGGETKVDRTDADFVMGNRDTLIGLVQDYKSGKPVEEFTVSIAAGDGVLRKATENAGTFELSSYARDTRLHIRAAGYAELETAPLSPHPNEMVTSRTFAMGPGARVKGALVDWDTSRPLEGIPVYGGFHQTGFSDREPTGTAHLSNAQGEFEFEVPWIGQAIITALPNPPYVSASTTGETEHGKTKDVGVIMLEKTGRIDGLVLRNGVGLPDEKITLHLRRYPSMGEWKLTTNGMGEFSLPEAPPGAYFVNLDERNMQRLIWVSSGNQEKVLFHLGSGEVAGTITMGGKPADAYIELFPAEKFAGIDVNYDSGSGRFKARDVPAGEWTLNVWCQDLKRPLTEKCTLAEGQRWYKDFILPVPQMIKGIVTDSAGNRVKGGTVKVVSEHDPENVSADRIAANGNYSVGKLTAGTYRLTFQSPSSGVKEVENFTISEQPAPHRLDVVLDDVGGTIIVTAINGNTGLPERGVQCHYSGFTFESTDVSGQAVIRNVPAGLQKVSLNKQCFANVKREVDVRRGETVNLQELMHPGGEARIDVRHTTSIGGTTCVLEPIDGETGSGPLQFVAFKANRLQISAPVGNYKLTLNLPEETVSLPFTIPSCVQQAWLLRKGSSGWELIRTSGQ